jgi:hypothetical protein
VIGMKVRYRVILLIPVHVDHGPVERADTRHDLTVSDPPEAGRGLACPEQRLFRCTNSMPEADMRNAASRFLVGHLDPDLS